MFWKRLANIILKNRLTMLGGIAGLSIFMAFEATKVKIAFNSGKVLPVTDSAYIRYNQFKKIFGQDAGTIVLGIKSDRIFETGVFNGWHAIADSIQHIKGIKAVVSVANLYNLKKDTAKHRFELKPLTGQNPLSAQQVDSVKQQLQNLPFYNGLIFNKNENATLMAVTFENNIVNTPYRVPVLKKITWLAGKFQERHHIKVHVSGLPFIRTVVANLISHEFGLFLSLSLAITALILALFFRSGYAVIFPVLIVVLGVTWSLGILVLAHDEITILTGIIPPLVVVIGIPNSVFLLNKYYFEYGQNPNKADALCKVIEKAGITTFIANITTAIGFGVLCFTNSELLTEFGWVASLSIMATFALSLILIPIIFSYLPQPRPQQTGIKNIKLMQKVLEYVNNLVQCYRKTIYACTLILLTVCGYGISLINVNGFVVDDLPRRSAVLADMKFFEANFKGVLPLEISIDTKRKNGLMNLGTMRKIEKLEALISSYPQFSRSVSLIQVLKFSTQAFYGGDQKYYRLPDNLEQGFIFSYAANSGKGTDMLRNYMDKDRRITRVSFEMRDAGSKKVNKLVADLQPRIDSIFNPKKFHVELTGSSMVFVKGTNYLVKNLYQSLALAILLIAGVMWILFRGLKMIAISLLPNLIPLVITAGIMGFCGIPLKPSTILIFSIAMGISSDQTIYFLTRYRQELRDRQKSISQIVLDTIKETGVSMIYIATILFFGFGIFAASTFGGTVALGVLIAITLLVAMVSNLILLPAFLLSAEKSIKRGAEGEFIDLRSRNYNG